jgi:hypothetical protein
MWAGKTIPLPGFYNAQAVDYMLKCLIIGGLKFFRLSTLAFPNQMVKPFLTFDLKNPSPFS